MGQGMSTALRRIVPTLAFAVAVMDVDCAARAQRDQREPPAAETDRLLREGQTLRAEQVSAAEQRLRRDPDDVSARLSLIGYCGQREAPCSGEAYDSLVLGLIERRPRWKIASEISLSRGGQDRGAKLWLSLAKANPRDPRVLGNAGFFLTADIFNRLNVDQWAEGEKLLSEARRLEPTNPRWPEKLGQNAAELVETDVRATPEARRAQATRALGYLEEASRLTPEAERADRLYSNGLAMADIALQAGETAKARQYAADMLKWAAEHPKSWNRGNAIHQANTALGLIALREGDITAANRYLLDSARNGGSPQLDSYGPSLELARELLAKGDREAVLQYLDLCGAFWKDPQGQLPRWKASIRAGRTPEGSQWGTATAAATPGAAPVASPSGDWSFKVLHGSSADEIVRYGPAGAVSRKARNGMQWVSVLAEVTPPAARADLPTDAVSIADAAGGRHRVVAIAGFDTDAPGPTYVSFDDVGDARRLSFPAARYGGPAWRRVYLGGRRLSGAYFHDASPGGNSSFSVTTGRALQIDRGPARVFLLFESPVGDGRFALEIDGRRQAEFQTTREHSDRAVAMEKACHAGDGEACFRVAAAYLSGSGVPSDSVRGADLLKKACDRGVGHACTFMATSHGKDPRLYQKACDLGDESGCTALGTRYLNGEGVPKDEGRAAALFRKACAAGGMLACTDLGVVYARGAGVPRDRQRAIELYQRACDAGINLACTNLSALFDPFQPADGDDTGAAEFHRKACDAGDAWSCSALGYRYEHGKGVPHAGESAAAFYVRGCERGSAWSCWALGEMYWSGYLIPRDWKVAAAWYQKGCDGNDRASCANLGVMYRRGMGVAQDDARGRGLLQRACSEGDAKACQEMK